MRWNCQQDRAGPKQLLRLRPTPKTPSYSKAHATVALADPELQHQDDHMQRACREHSVYVCYRCQQYSANANVPGSHVAQGVLLVEARVMNNTCTHMPCSAQAIELYGLTIRTSLEYNTLWATHTPYLAPCIVLTHTQEEHKKKCRHCNMTYTMATPMPLEGTQVIGIIASVGRQQHELLV